MKTNYLGIFYSIIFAIFIRPAFAQIKPNSEKEEPIYVYVESMPKLGGKYQEVKSITDLVQARVKYPKIARQDSVQGRILASFIVEATGEVSNAKIIKGIGAGCDEAVLGVIKSLPRFEPGRQSNRNVRVSYTFPIIFQLDPINHPLKLPNYGLDGRIAHTANGWAVAFNDYEGNTISAMGLNFWLDFGNTKVSGDGGVGFFTVNNKLVRLSVSKLPAQTAISNDYLLLNYIKPKFLQSTNTSPNLVPIVSQIQLSNGKQAQLWEYVMPDNSQFQFASFTYEKYIFILAASQLSGADPKITRDALLFIAQAVKISRKPIILDAVR
jgi:TonB family protein